MINAKKTEFSERSGRGGPGPPKGVVEKNLKCAYYSPYFTSLLVKNKHTFFSETFHFLSKMKMLLVESKDQIS